MYQIAVHQTLQGIADTLTVGSWLFYYFFVLWFISVIFSEGVTSSFPYTNIRKIRVTAKKSAL